MQGSFTSEKEWVLLKSLFWKAIVLVVKLMISIRSRFASIFLIKIYMLKYYSWNKYESIFFLIVENILTFDSSTKLVREVKN